MNAGPASIGAASHTVRLVATLVDARTTVTLWAVLLLAAATLDGATVLTLVVPAPVAVPYVVATEVVPVDGQRPRTGTVVPLLVRHVAGPTLGAIALLALRPPVVEGPTSQVPRPADLAFPAAGLVTTPTSVTRTFTAVATAGPVGALAVEVPTEVRPEVPVPVRLPTEVALPLMQEICRYEAPVATDHVVGRRDGVGRPIVARRVGLARRGGPLTVRRRPTRRGPVGATRRCQVVPGVAGQAIEPVVPVAAAIGVVGAGLATPAEPTTNDGQVHVEAVPDPEVAVALAALAVVEEEAAVVLGLPTLLVARAGLTVRLLAAVAIGATVATALTPSPPVPHAPP